MKPRLPFAWLALLLLTAPVELVDITFDLTVASDTPASAVVYISGNLPQLGGWQPAKVPLKRTDTGHHTLTLSLPRDSDIEFKFTRGTWAAVEKSTAGRDIPNRRLKIEKSARVELTVESFTAIPSTLTGDIRHHPAFASKILANQRDIWVYLPPGYKDNTDQRYPILYMHDGQNAFDQATSFAGEWQADETAERLIRAKKIRLLIIVAVSNTLARADEYTPTADPGRKVGGRAKLYARFLIEEIKPFIDKTYRTSPAADDTAVAGSSLGGLVSLYLAHRHPDTFAKSAALSPSLWWDDRRLLKEITKDPAPLAKSRIYFDMGSDEGEQYVRDVTDLAKALDGKDILYKIDPGGRHEEKAWAGRFDQVLLYLFPPPPR